MFKKIKLLLLLSLVIFIGFGAVKSEAHMMMKMSKMMKMKMFFLRHSLGFGPIFYQYHPGPMWILKNAKALHLNAYQISQEKILEKGMFTDTKSDIKSLKAAIKVYKAIAQTDNPGINQVETAVDNVGNAETRLAKVMMPFHLKGYGLLNASQRVIFKKLAKANWDTMTAKMKIMHKMMMIHMMIKLCHMKLRMLRHKMMMLGGGHGKWDKNKGKMHHHKKGSGMYY
jgi:hypothetical protein